MNEIGKMRMSEVDIFYISYDEPNAEENWADLLEKAPWAKRVHGVKGFDAAHKACAEQSETNRFITVDGDTVIYPEFLDAEVNITERFRDCSLSWGSVNAINGLVYGNGGLKLWTRDFVMNMRTHEHAKSEAEKLDFCWDEKYVQLNNTYSETRPNGSPFQAFRAGFREGCKMTLDRGNKVDPRRIGDVLHRKNLNRLLIWANVGADVENGDWAIYGSRLGMVKTNIEPNFDLSKISDYDWFKEYFTREVWPEFLYDHDRLFDATQRLGHKITKELALPMGHLGPNESAFFKRVYESPARTVDPLITEIEADLGKVAP